MALLSSCPACDLFLPGGLPPPSLSFSLSLFLSSFLSPSLPPSLSFSLLPSLPSSFSLPPSLLVEQRVVVEDNTPHPPNNVSLFGEKHRPREAMAAINGSDRLLLTW